MNRSDIAYDLKQFLFKEVENTYSGLLWAMLGLQTQLTITSKIPGITQVKSNLFQSYDAVIWKQSGGKKTYWELLGLLHPFANNGKKDIVTALTGLGDRLFSFVRKIIANAPEEYNKLKTQKKARIPILFC